MKRISELQHRSIKIGEDRLKNEQNFRDCKRHSTYIIRVQERGWVWKSICRSRAENFPKVATDMNLHIWKAKLISKRINLRKSSARQMIDKLLKTKDKYNFKSSKRQIEPYHSGERNWSVSGFFIRNHGD